MAMPTNDDGSVDGKMRMMLAMGRAAKRRIRCRIAGASLAVAVGAVFMFGVTRSVLVPRLTNVYFQAAVSGVSGLFMALGFCGAFLAAQPNDPIATRAAPLLLAVAISVSAIPWITTGISNLSDYKAGHCNSSGEESLRDSAGFCLVDAVGLLFGAALFVAAAVGYALSGTMRYREPRARHAAFRRVVMVHFGTLVYMNTYTGIARIAYGEIAWGVLTSLVAAVGWTAAVVLVARPAAVARVHARLGRLGDRTGTTAAAAGIAGLIGKTDIDHVVKNARRRFRAIRFTDLSEEDIKSNEPNPELYARATAVALGEADAFISHSWHDDPAAKYMALKKWCTTFEQQHGRQPWLWLDKCCIDQNDIDANLCCLPLFLSGCTKLVMLAGESYTSRLWCVMELFIFVYAGGLRENVEVCEAHAPGGQQAVVDSFLKFDAHDAKCFDPNDKAHMLRVIESAFGDMQSFNEVIRPFVRHFNRSNSGRLNLGVTSKRSFPSEGEKEDTPVRVYSSERGHSLSLEENNPLTPALSTVDSTVARKGSAADYECVA